MGGLSFSKDGGETVEVAMTMDGAITANFITVGTMAADRIRTGLLQSENDNFSLNLNDGTLVMKKGSIDLGNGNFIVTSEGEMTANEATIHGSIFASGGEIAGFTLEPEYMHTGGGNYYVAMNGSDTNKEKEYAFWCGNPVPGDAPFWVKKDGEFYASKGTFSGTLEAATGNFLGIVQATDFLDRNGNSMFTSQNKFSADYLDLYGLTIRNKSTGLITFRVDPQGDVTINGDITMGAASTIDWALVTNVNLNSNPAYSLAKQANNRIPSYIQSTHIDATTIESPTIRGGTFVGQTFDIIAGTGSGSLNLYGSFNANAYHMLAIDYFEGDSPEVWIHSPADADLYFGSDGYCFIYFTGDITFRGTVDFSNATVKGLK